MNMQNQTESAQNDERQSKPVMSEKIVKRSRYGLGILLALVFMLVATVMLFVSSSRATKVQNDRQTAEIARLSAENKEIQRKTNPAISNEYLIIKEWGVKIPQNYVGDMYYKVEGNVAVFGSKTLDSVCKGQEVRVGRGTGDEIWRSSGGDAIGTTKERYDKLRAAGSQTVWKVGDYYYLYPIIGQSACAVELERAATYDILSRVIFMETL
ncbi:hypothetical protein IPL85_05820 [Candidatus Saccharibacteria bacterium]|nr:MAG: hypothetical protein IPL85_05820 [Candidatus Saccharibacteria bacterium]